MAVVLGSRLLGSLHVEIVRMLLRVLHLLCGLYMAHLLRVECKTLKVFARQQQYTCSPVSGPCR